MPLIFKVCILLLCACMSLVVPVTGGIISEPNPELEVLGPEKEGNRAELLMGVRQMLANAGASCEAMLESAGAKGPEAQRIAAEARDAHAQRLAELEEMDFSGVPEAEMAEYIDEISGIIASFRAARDAIEAMD